MLTITEEILLLMLDDEDGSFLPLRESTTAFIVAGSTLMDLAFKNRIDTDPERLIVLNRTPTGNAILDRTLDRITESEETRDTAGWIELLARQGASDLRDLALASLVEHGVLEVQDQKFLWVFRERKYPIIDGRAQREAKLRLTDVLLSDDIPDPRDAAMICLADACDILGDIFAPRELERAATRIAQLRQMDLIGREVGSAIVEIERSIVMALTQTPH